MSEPKKRVREEDEEEAGEPANLSADEVERLFPKQKLVDALTSVLATWFDAISAEEPDLAKDPISAEGSAD